MLYFKKWLERELAPTATVSRAMNTPPGVSTDIKTHGVKQIIDQIDASRHQRTRPSAEIRGTPSYMSPEQAWGEKEKLPDEVERLVGIIKFMAPGLNDKLLDQLNMKWQDFRNSLYQLPGMQEQTIDEVGRFAPNVSTPTKVHIDLAYMGMNRLKNLLPQLSTHLQSLSAHASKKFQDFYQHYQQSQDAFNDAIEMVKRNLPGGYQPAGPLIFPQRT